MATVKFQKEEHHKHPYPQSMLSEFWKHGLNPITGHVPDEDNYINRKRADSKYHYGGAYFERPTQK
jgi:hypothetical protein